MWGYNLLESDNKSPKEFFQNIVLGMSGATMLNKAFRVAAK